MWLFSQRFELEIKFLKRLQYLHKYRIRDCSKCGFREKLSDSKRSIHPFFKLKKFFSPLIFCEEKPWPPFSWWKGWAPLFQLLKTRVYLLPISYRDPVISFLSHLGVKNQNLLFQNFNFNFQNVLVKSLRPFSEKISSSPLFGKKVVPPFLGKK